MAQTVAEFPAEAPRRLGRQRVYADPDPCINGMPACLHHGAGAPALHPGAARGARRLHGLRPLEVHGRGRRVPGDVGAGRHPPPERALRDGPPGGRRHRRPAGPGRPSAAATSRRSIPITLFKDVAHEYVHMASSPLQVRHLVDRAMRIARAERTVTCVIVPKDVQEMGTPQARPQAHGTVHSGLGDRLPAHPAQGRPHPARPTCSTPASGWRCRSARARSAPGRR